MDAWSWRWQAVPRSADEMSPQAERRRWSLLEETQSAVASSTWSTVPPWPLSTDEPGLAEAVDRLGEGIVELRPVSRR